MKAIAIKYAGPTNMRGSRWIVSDSDHRMSVSIRHDLNQADDHKRCLDLFCEKYRKPETRKPIGYHYGSYKDLDLYIPIFD